MIMGKIRGLTKVQPPAQGQSPVKNLVTDSGLDDIGAVTTLSWPKRSNGPWDFSEVNDTSELVDLGSLMLRPRAGVEVRVEVHQESGQVVRVVALSGDGAVNLQAFAATKSAPIWPELIERIKIQALESGAQAHTVEGGFGQELVISDGSRWVGIDGPRWLLRCIYSGSAKRPSASGVLDDFVNDVVVVRGFHAMPPGDALPIKMPEQLDQVLPIDSIPSQGESARHDEK